MNKRWYHHLLLSYLPVFFLITLSLIFISFYSIGKFTERAAVTANSLFTQYAIQVIDNSLKTIDQSMYKELSRNEKFNYFFYNVSNNSTYYTVYEPSRLINDIMSGNNLIDSIYIVRSMDKTVLSPNGIMELDQFGDREYIYRHLNNPPQFTETIDWSAKREYKEFPNGTPKQVVSLVFRTPLVSGSLGLVVVNVSIETLGKLISGLSSSNISYMQLLDKEGNLIKGGIPDTVKGYAHIDTVRSDYSGWTMESTLKSDTFFSFVNSISVVSVLIGAFLIILGVLWILYVSKRNSRPVESITEQIQAVLQTNGSFSLNKKSKNEFQFISSAVEAMIDELHQYSKKDVENLAYRRQSFLRELFEWQQPMTMEQWRGRMIELGLPYEFTKLTVGVIEIDKYSGFVKQYSVRDQNLLRFAMFSAVKEMSDKHQLTSWSEWRSDSHISTIHYGESDPNEYYKRIFHFYEDLAGWIHEYLGLTVSIGLGSPMSDIMDLSESYEHAMEALDYKLTLGDGQIIEYLKIRGRSQGEAYDHFQLISQIAQQYRLGQNGWKAQLQQFFQTVQQQFISDSDFQHLMNYLIFHLDKEMRKLPAGQAERWVDAHLPELHRLMETDESLKNICNKLEMYLSHIFDELQTLRTTRNSYQQMEEVKGYIDQHFHQSDLSLDYLGEKFGIAPKYVSQLFKEELGEKFVDYLAKVRVEHAKRLLQQPNGTVQEIAEKVGYAHSFSFIRVFKKIAGQTPGDYRNEYADSGRTKNEDS
ncbi:helix-turn-helix domain-containing protein [Paenibacillus piri]|uniref:helix-turn-helix domain-containing protein n=1 Tax=Paenibacillus piri TaxID=2547395 RepID=UPI0014054EA3|nr:helix-turn-helix domain-containing protein [Paenibacillus piri]